jgi:hypothetical protein
VSLNEPGADGTDHDTFFAVHGMGAASQAVDLLNDMSHLLLGGSGFHAYDHDFALPEM